MKYATHYDAIPEELLLGETLDVGCGDFSNQHKSRHSSLILFALAELRWCGIDVEQDLFKWETHTLFDTVLAIHVIEHVPKEKWYMMFEKLCGWVKPGGSLVIGTPYRQSPNVYKHFKGPENQRHVVFGIDEHTIQHFLRPVQVIRYTGPYSESLMCIWRKE